MFVLLKKAVLKRLKQFPRRNATRGGIFVKPLILERLYYLTGISRNLFKECLFSRASLDGYFLIFSCLVRCSRRFCRLLLLSCLCGIFVWKFVIHFCLIHHVSESLFISVSEQISIPFTAWKVFKYGVFSGLYFPACELNIQSEYGKIKSPNTDQKKLSLDSICIWTLFTQCFFFKEFQKLIQIFWNYCRKVYIYWDIW